MARIEGVDLPRNKRVEVGLTYIYGIGLPRAQKILAETRVSPDTRVKDLTDAEVALLRDYIGQSYKVEGDLRREVQLNIKRRSRLAAIAACATAATCRFAGSAPEPIRAPAKVRKRR